MSPLTYSHPNHRVTFQICGPWWKRWQLFLEWYNFTWNYYTIWVKIAHGYELPDKPFLWNWAHPAWVISSHRLSKKWIFWILNHCIWISWLLGLKIPFGGSGAYLEHIAPLLSSFLALFFLPTLPFSPPFVHTLYPSRRKSYWTSAWIQKASLLASSTWSQEVFSKIWQLIERSFDRICGNQDYR